LLKHETRLKIQILLMYPLMWILVLKILLTKIILIMYQFLIKNLLIIKLIILFILFKEMKYLKVTLDHTQELGILLQLLLRLTIKK